MSYLSELLAKYRNAPAPDIGLINAGVRDHNESAEAHADVRTKIDTGVAALESAIDDIVNEGASAGTGVMIADAGEYYDGENAETVLQEIGAQLSAVDTQLAQIGTRIDGILGEGSSVTADVSGTSYPPSHSRNRVQLRAMRDRSHCSIQ